MSQIVPKLLEQDRVATLRSFVESFPWDSEALREIAEASLVAAERAEEWSEKGPGAWADVPPAIRAAVESDPDLCLAPASRAPASAPRLHAAERAMLHWEALRRIDDAVFGPLAARLARSGDWHRELTASVLPAFPRPDPPAHEPVVALALCEHLLRGHTDRPLEIVDWVLRCDAPRALRHWARTLHAQIALLRGSPGDLDEIRAAVLDRARTGRERARANLVVTRRAMSVSGPVSAMRFARAAIAEALAVRDRRSAGQGAQLLAHLRGIIGESESAMELFHAALALQRGIGDRLGEGMTLASLTTFSDEQGDPRDIRKSLEQALAIHREVGNRRSEAAALCNLAIRSQKMGDTLRTDELLERAVAICREVGDRWTEGMALLNLGVHMHHGGNYGRARELLDRALRIQREMGNRRFEGVTLQNLAKLHRQTGDPKRAANLFDRALAIFRELGDRASEAEAIRELADGRRAAGELGRALDLFEQALEIHRDVGDQTGQAKCLVSLAALRETAGETREARRLQRRALALHRRLGNVRGEGTVLRDWSRAELRRGRPRRAVVLATRACRCLDGAADILALIDARHVLAESLRSVGDTGAAAAEYERAVDDAEHLLRDIGADSRRVRVLEGSQPLLGDAGTFFLEDAGDPERAFEMAERAKARSLLELVRGERGSGAAAGAVDEKRSGLELHLRALQDALIEEKSAPAPRRGLVGYLEGELQRVRREHSALLDDLALADPGLAASEGLVKPLDLARVRERVVAGADVALLEYFAAGDVLHLWVVREERAHALTLERGVAEIEALVDKVVAPLVGDTPRPVALLPRDLRRLAHWVLESALEHLQGVRRLLVVPSGPLHRLPFEMLVLRMPGERGWDAGEGVDRFAAPEYVCERFEIGYGPSATLLDPALIRARGAPAAEPTVLAFGDPVYAQAESSADTLVHLPRLPGTAEEVRLLQQIYPKTRALVREQAREAAYREHAGAADIIHLGCHGLVDGDDPSYAGVVLSAGARHREDAWLQSYEIAEVTLERAPIVVISACHVAGGRVSGAEGILGLSRAFVQAGARAVVASLWSVEDRGVVVLIERFYRALAAADGDAVAALAEARREQLADQRADPRLERIAPESHPYFWAGFRVFGR